jgi:LytS/YehU family sensor histidine kinase
VRTALTYLLVTKNIWPEAAAGQEAFSLNHIIAVTLGEFYVLAVATAIKLTIDWVQQRQRIENLKKEQLKSELNFLKAQIQPHFFFNTLNNLYALTLEKSNQAPSVVLKLSDIMQYVIYDIAAPKVPLLKEIEYLQNYIDLERFRCHENATIECSIDGDVTGVEVPPMIFLPYLENSFKHGNKYSDDFYIYISFEKTSEKQLVFRITNSLHPSDHSSTAGIGNNNTQRRLDLLYGNEHTLTINSSTNSFEVSLKLPLTLNDTK